jgi:hypothetical protein
MPCCILRQTGGQFTSDGDFDQRGPPLTSGWYLGIGQNSFPVKANFIGRARVLIPKLGENSVKTILIFYRTKRTHLPLEILSKLYDNSIRC